METLQLTQYGQQFAIMAHRIGVYMAGMAAKVIKVILGSRLKRVGKIRSGGE
ncbi:MAG: hypothetical protein LBQ00_06865 [Syntrophobacterales bacterium]|jgi:hypothetical protein|nr:hypothetical protein [Syntrophobacterales bacterium]